MFGVFRFILALNVMLFHILEIPNIGPFAVYSFFILSGFLMTTIMHESYGFDLRGLKRYSLNRFLRLYPVHWALLIITIVIISITGNDYAQKVNDSFGFATNFAEYITNLTLIFPNLHPIEVKPRLAPASWALTIEIFYYVLIGIGISKTKKITLIWFAFSTIFLFIYMALNKTYSAGYGNFFAASLPFSIGAIIYHYKFKISSIFSNFSSKYGFIITILFFLNLLVCATSHNWALDNSWKINTIGMYLNIFLSSILIVFLFNEGKNYFSKISDRFFGDLSYPIYLFHWSAACLTSWLIIGEPVKGISPINLIVFMAALIFTILISMLVNFSINTPIERIRYKIKHRS